MITRILQNGIVSKSTMPKLLTLILAILLVIVVGESRDLRPSEHGLPYQTLQVRSPDMVMFFGQQSSSSSPPEKKPPSPPIVESVNETASSGSWWKESPEKRKENRVRKVLVIATLVCGGTGVVLLLAAAFLFAVHLFRRRLETSSPSGVANNDANHSDSGSATVIAALPNNK